MDTNGREYVENELCYRVTGCAMAVLNDVGHGLREKTYERGLYVEFEEQGLAYNSQHVYPVFYKGRDYSQLQACQIRMEESGAHK